MKTFYACGVDWQHELGCAFDRQNLFETVEELKAKAPCWESCGIVKITMTADWIVPQDLMKGVERLNGDS